MVWKHYGLEIFYVKQSTAPFRLCKYVTKKDSLFKKIKKIMNIRQSSVVVQYTQNWWKIDLNYCITSFLHFNWGESCSPGTLGLCFGSLFRIVFTTLLLALQADTVWSFYPPPPICRAIQKHYYSEQQCHNTPTLHSTSKTPLLCTTHLKHYYSGQQHYQNKRWTIWLQLHFQFQFEASSSLTSIAIRLQLEM